MQKYEVSPCNSPGPTCQHSCSSHGRPKAEGSPTHSSILTHSLSLVHPLSLSTLSHTQARRRRFQKIGGEGKEKKGEGIGAWKQQEMAMEIT
jgi:hypothetical protein